MIAIQNKVTMLLVNITLNIAEFDPSQRGMIFKQLMCYLFHESNHARFFISKMLMEELMSFDTVIAFMEHFIKFCNEDFLMFAKRHLEKKVNFKQKIDPNFSLKKQRKQMVAYKNSLVIMKHFNGLTLKNICLDLTSYQRTHLI